MGAAHEQPAGTGRGTGADGIDLQLSFLDANIPTEAPQIKKIDQAESEKTPSVFVLSQAEIENALRRGSNVEGSKLRIWKIYQLQPDRKLRAKALAKEYAPYGPGGSSHTYLDGSSGWLDHDSKGLTFEHYPDHQKVLLRWDRVEKYIDLMIQSDRYLSDKERRAIDFPLELNAASAAEYTALKALHPDTLVGFEAGGNFMFYGEDAAKVAKVLNSALFTRETALGEVQVTGFPPSLWARKSKELWSAGNNVYLAGLNEDGTHHQTKHLHKEDYLPIGSIINMDGRKFRIDGVDFDKGKVSLQDMALADLRMPIFREEPLSVVRELYEQQDEALDAAPEKAVDYKVGDDVVVDLPTRTIEGTVGYVGETDVRIDTSAQGQSWDNEVINKQQFEDGLRQVEPQLSDEKLDELPISTVMDGKVQTFPDAAALDEALNAVPAGNFHITDDHLGEGGAKQKYARNIEAIRTLFQLEQEHRGATAEEQQVLAQYVGWGGLADAFDPNKDGWTKEYAELKGLLSEDEYAAARSSTLNAHYTSPTVIRGIYDAVERMGFRSGNILEPSMGVGNFFGMLPSSMADSRLYGVELDSITGRIAKKLYPQADITVAGFETTDRRDFYDLAVGNVPFGQYKVNDKAYNKLGFSIHNYFFAKAIDQVRPGGVVAFVTSRYTLDSKDSSARKHMAERADLLGAIRLPNNAFRANAGTDVVSDIIFLQKRDRPADIEPAWVQLGKTEDGFAINQYFVDHPEMVLGQLTLESTQYGHDLTVAPIEGAVLADQLAEAVQHIEGNYTAVEIAAPDVADAEVQRKTLPADPTVKNFSYTVVDGEIYYRENSIMTQIELSDNAKGRVAGMVELRQIVNELIDQQLNDFPDEDIKASQAKLNAAYDAFAAKYGLINDKKNARLFDDDSSYYLLCSLENLDENKNLKSKADMFTKRTIRPERVVTSVDTPSEALAVSIGEHGKVDLPYMAELLGTPGNYERITTELPGVIFKDPAADADDPEAGWQTADEYLSGNVRDKLRMAQLAAESHPEFKVNVDALTKAQPKDLEASEIDVRLGATWLAPSIVQQFMMETFQPPYRIRYNNAITVRYSPHTSEWRISNKSATGFGDIMATETYGTRRANAYKILEDTLNLRDSRVYDTIEEDGKEKRVLNQNETTLAQQKQQAIKDAFAGWVWKDPQRRALLVKKYNELFNSTRPREYDGSHIHFVGMNPEINLREHQRNAVAHVLYGYNTLLAHEVGAGKSFEMAASAMELKRLGLCQKSLFVVPNHLTEQWASEFLRLYPNAKLLVTSKKDFEPGNRKKFCARIATGDYDAVIIGHSQFEKIPLSAERQERLIQEQMDEIEEAIEEAKAQVGEHFTVKQLEKLRKSLKQKLEKLQGADRKDDVVTFEQLGVDRLFVDESQAFKNLYLYTKMRNVAGLSTSEAQKSSDMFGKCRYLDEITGGRGVIFATGTPLSNSMTEMYTLMRYLQYNTLQQKGLTHFDAWASTFGETTTAIELAPEGTGYRARTRFAKFFNLPELMAMFKEAADIKTSDQLNLPVPQAKFETVVVKPSEIQQDMVQALSERAAEVHSGSVDPSVDNMLKITSDGRKIGLDQRLMNSALPDDPSSKLNACVNNVLRIWNDTKEQKLTQLIFCDMSTPKGDGSFNVYDDIRSKLLTAGVPEQEIEFIHNADTENKKAELFSKVRSGQVRVLLGSTAKMGAGTNVQTLLVAVHHLDVGWRPSDMTQRNGRIIRQGNQNKQVYVYNYVTESTFDAYLYQTLENKQKFISQIMTSKSPMRSCDDIDEQALSYAEIKALCAGDPRIREKMDLDVQVAKLKVLRGDFQNQKYRLEDKLLKTFPEEIQKQKTRIAALQQDSQIAAAHPQDKENFCGMTIKGMVYDDKKAAGERLLLARQEMPNADMMLLGTYRGFELNIRFDSFKNEHQAVLRAELSYPVSLGDDARGNITRLDNAIDNFADRIADAENALQNLEQQKQAAEVEVAKPFAQEEELAEKSARLSELNALLNIDRDRSSSQDAPEETEETETPATRPSVLAALGEKVNQPEPVKPFRSYYDKDGDAR
ncbi:MAG: DEAD/DEAH box helicase family protein [Faecalibacterium prausnitzii]